MDELFIYVNNKRNKNNNHTISIIVADEILGELNNISKETNLSRNAIINRFIKYGLDNYEIR